MDNYELLKRLQSEARRRKVLPTSSTFDCEHYHDCQRSRRERGIPLLHGWRTALMSNVGREYGRQVAGKAFRLVIVGMSHAGDGGSDFFERQRDSEKALRRKVNPHYRGVLKMAASLLGKHSCECNRV